MAWSGSLTAGTLRSNGDISFAAAADIVKASVAITVGTHTTATIAHGLGAAPDKVSLTVTSRTRGADSQELVAFLVLADATNVQVGAVSVGDGVANTISAGTIRVVVERNHTITG